MLGRALILMVLVLANVNFHRAGEKPPAARPADPEAVVAHSSVWLGPHRWHFSSSPTAKEIAVEVHQDDGIRQFSLPVAKGLGPIVTIDAAVLFTKTKLWIVGLGIVSRSSDGQKLEYRMYEGRGTEVDLIAGKYWTGCGILMTRPVDAPFSMVAVSLPGGDSLMLTLQEIKRDAGHPDRIETHVFVNHCPASLDEEFNSKHTDHYVSVIDAPKSAK